MINFIIYEDEKEMREKYKKIILCLILKTKLRYSIHEFSRYNSKTKDIIKKGIGSKIYLIDINVPGKSGLDLAKEIRNEGDWESPIIFITADMSIKNHVINQNLLILNYITKNYNLETNLKEALKTSYKIINGKEYLYIENNREILIIPHRDILYIEKVLNKKQCLIITKEQEYIVNKNLTTIAEKLKDNIAFVKTHRCCIVNLLNISNLDMKNAHIKFNNKKTILLSRNGKKDLKDNLR